MSSKKVRVAIIGVGNCASSLVQGVHYYRNAPDDGFIPGLMHPRLAGYHVGDIEFSAAFDVDERKVGKDLSEAIFEAPNTAMRRVARQQGVPLVESVDSYARVPKEEAKFVFLARIIHA